MLKGTDLTITAGTSNILAYCKSCVIDMKRDLEEVADPSSAKYKKFKPKRISWTINNQQMFASGSGYSALKSAVESDSGVSVSVDINGTKSTGTAFVKDVKITGRVHDILQCDVTLQGSGALS